MWVTNRAGSQVEFDGLDIGSGFPLTFAPLIENRVTMNRFFQWLLAAWRALWLGTLKLLGLPWRWLARLLGPSGPAGPAPHGNKGDGDRPAERPPRERAAPPAPTERTRADDRSADSTDDLAPAAAAFAGEPLHAEAGPVFASAAADQGELPAARKGAIKPGQFTEGVFRNDAGQRDFKLYIPGGKPEGKLPLVVMLHGCKQDPDDFAAGTRMNQFADHQPMLVLYPAQTKSANPYACWNWFNRHNQQRDAGEPSIIAGMIEQVLAKHPVDPRRVYAAGLSAGGAMATILAHTYPELLAAAGVHSGLPFAAAQDMITALGVMKRGAAQRAAPPRAKPSAKLAAARAAVPLIVFHGDHDQTVHPLNGERVVEQALEAARAAKPHDLGHRLVKPGRVPGGHAYTRTTHADRAGQVLVEHWVVAGSGHAWSGGDAQGSFTDPLGPDASHEMLRFFFERSKA